MLARKQDIMYEDVPTMECEIVILHRYFIIECYIRVSVKKL